MAVQTLGSYLQSRLGGQAPAAGAGTATPAVAGVRPLGQVLRERLGAPTAPRPLGQPTQPPRPRVPQESGLYRIGTRLENFGGPVGGLAGMAGPEVGGAFGALQGVGTTIASLASPYEPDWRKALGTARGATNTISGLYGLAGAAQPALAGVPLLSTLGAGLTIADLATNPRASDAAKVAGGVQTLGSLLAGPYAGPIGMATALFPPEVAPGIGTMLSGAAAPSAAAAAGLISADLVPALAPYAGIAGLAGGVALVPLLAQLMNSPYERVRSQEQSDLQTFVPGAIEGMLGAQRPEDVDASLRWLSGKLGWDVGTSPEAWGHQASEQLAPYVQAMQHTGAVMKQLLAAAQAGDPQAQQVLAKAREQAYQSVVGRLNLGGAWQAGGNNLVSGAAAQWTPPSLNWSQADENYRAYGYDAFGHPWTALPAAQYLPRLGQGYLTPDERFAITGQAFAPSAEPLWVVGG